MSIKKPSFNKDSQISCGNLFLDLSEPKVMGILNLTDDSFYDGGKYNKLDKYLFRAAEMIESGAQIIDVGAASTRPGAGLIKEAEEWEVLQKPLYDLRMNFPQTILSVDTYNAMQVPKCADIGVNIINDISGGLWDDRMFSQIASFKMAYILMHIQGQPDNMQNAPFYNSVNKDVEDYFKERIAILNELNFHNIILDPGFGFGKTIEHNYQLLSGLKKFSGLNYPVLAGLSRKSMVFNVLNTSADESLNGTTVLNTLALGNGAKILRVHDVKEALEAIELFREYEKINI